DPMRDPAMYALGVLVRVPLYLLGQWLPLGGDWEIVLSRGQAFVFAAVAAIAVLVVLGAVFRQLGWAPREWAFGLRMLLAVLPICAAMPMARSLFFVGLGAMPLMAAFFRELGWLDGGPTVPASRLVRWVGVLLFATHLIGAPLQLGKYGYAVKLIGSE